ncbi:MAG: Abi family protein [Hyphomicrobiales bacterium]
MRNAIINAALERTITRERLDKYLIETHGDLDAALALYERNTKLSEAFYTPLQCLEICLRNTLNTCMSNVYGKDWFRNGNAPLNHDAQIAILDAYREVSKPEPIPIGDVVAELKFSFWVGLMGPRYDATLWRKALYRGFQVTGCKKRSEVHGRFNALRRFRNRIAHHEPIFHRDLSADHDEIIEAIGWMCSDTKAWAAYHSRVPQVIRSG